MLDIAMAILGRGLKDTRELPSNKPGAIEEILTFALAAESQAGIAAQEQPIAAANLRKLIELMVHSDAVCGTAGDLN